MEKPAGILIHLETNFKTQMEKNKEFRIALYIGKESSQRYSNVCFHERLNDIMRSEDIEYCSFTGNSLETKGYHKFFPLPMFSLSFESFLQQGNTNIPVRVAVLYRHNEKNCKTEKTFKINLIKTHNLKLGFTRIDGGNNCFASRNIHTGYDITPFHRVRDFVNSDEVLYKIERMFPILKADSYAIRYSWNKRSYDYVPGNCNNNPAVERPRRTVGLLADIAMLEYIRASLKYDKLIAIVPESYFTFHRGLGHGSSGFFVQPLWKDQFLWWKQGFLGGSWNVAIVHEDQKDKGTVSHELAHILGQGRELYETHEMCRQFRGSSLESCENYQIPISLEADESFWRLIENKFSIVNNRGRDIEDRWVDRDTYQKTFKVLSRKAVIPSDEELLGESIVASDYHREKEDSLKVVVSGFYYEKEDAFIVPNMTIEQTELLTPSLSPNIENIELPFITFQLKEGESLLQEIKRPIFKMNLKTIYKNETSQTEAFEFSPAMAIFKLPENSQKRSLQIFALNPKDEVIYSASIPNLNNNNGALMDEVP